MKIQSVVLFIVCFLQSFFSVNAQLSHIKWTAVELTAGMQGNLHENMATDNFGNTFVIHQTQNATSFEITYRFFCYDKEGNEKWQFDNDTSLTMYSFYNLVVPTQDGGAIFLGTNLKRIGANGQLIWQMNYNLPNDAMALVAKLDASQKLVVGIRYFSPPLSIEDFGIAKYDISTGIEEWHLVLPDASPVTGEYLVDEIIDLEIDTQNNIWALGLSGNTFINIFHERLFKVNSAGVLQWNYLVSTTTLNSQFNAFCLDKRSYAHLTGTLNANSTQLQTISPSGSFLPLLIYQRDSAQTNGVDIVADSLSNVYEVSKFRYWIPDTTFAGGQWCKYNYVVRKLDTFGTQAWVNAFLVTPKSFELSYGYPLGLVYDAPNLYVASLGRLNIQQAENNFLVNKVDSNGNQVWFQASPDYSTSTKGTVLTKDTLNNIYGSYTAQAIFPAPLIGMVHRYSDSLVHTLITYDQAFIQTKAIQLFWWQKQESLHIYSNEPLSGQLQLFSSGGTLLLSQPYSGLSLDIPIAHLTKGIYFVRLNAKLSTAYLKIQIL